MRNAKVLRINKLIIGIEDQLLNMRTKLFLNQNLKEEIKNTRCVLDMIEEELSEASEEINIHLLAQDGKGLITMFQKFYGQEVPIAAIEVNASKRGYWRASV